MFVVGLNSDQLT